MRAEIRGLIDAESDLRVVGQSGGGEEGVRDVRRLHPDLVVMDVVMPGMNGIEAARAIREFDTRVPILALSNHTGANLVKAVLEAGAGGYVRKDHAFEELVPAIRAVAAGRAFMGRGVSV